MRGINSTFWEEPVVLKNGVVYGWLSTCFLEYTQAFPILLFYCIPFVVTSFPFWFRCLLLLLRLASFLTLIGFEIEYHYPRQAQNLHSSKPLDFFSYA